MSLFKEDNSGDKNNFHKFKSMCRDGFDMKMRGSKYLEMQTDDYR